MRIALAVLALTACERADRTYSIGWEPPRAGEKTDVVTHYTSHGSVGDHVIDSHIVAEDTKVDGDRISAVRDHYLSYTRDGQPVPRGTYEITARDAVRVDGTMSAEEREDVRVSDQLVFIDPAPRKRVAMHAFRIGEPYELADDEVVSLGFERGYQLRLVLRGVERDGLRFDVESVMPSVHVHGTLESFGASLRCFHQVVDMTSDGATIHEDLMQRDVP